MINGENVFDQPIKNNKVTHENIRKIATGQGYDCTTGSLLDYSYFMDTYKMIAVDLSKRQVSRNKKKKHNKIIMLARSKLNSIESKVSEALINSEISHEDFMVIINEEKKYRELKESIRMMNSQRSDSEKINPIEEGKKNRH